MNPPARKPVKRASEIPIAVKVERSTGPKPSLPPVVLATPAKPAKRPPAKPHAARIIQPVHTLPIEQRKKLMWGIVAGGMFVVMLGWALTLGHELRQDAEPNLISQLTNVFRSFKLPSHKPEPTEQEIRQLEDQVFPQF